ncbi:MAG: 3-oxoacyl-ACP reductase FabG [Deltaproteobacteria bacterium]|nr:3-oxoacyl-ACP reductase FabG [Deltaproteobacteria bacterium]
MGNALITGASGGIGSAVAKALAEAGHSVQLHYFRNRTGAEATARTIVAEGGRAETICFDIRDRQSVENAINEWSSGGRSIDILVNNAGIIRDGLFYWMKPEDWNEVIETNLNGIYNVTRVVLPMMVRQSSGIIVNVSSISALSGNVGQTNYSAAKAGIIGFTKSLAQEAARQNIRVNAVAPGLIETEMTREVPGELKKRIPMRRLGTPDEVAGVVVFLCSDAASYVLGETINVNGGFYCQ